MTSANKEVLRQLMTNINVLDISLDRILYIHQQIYIKKMKKKPAIFINLRKKNNIMTCIYIKVGLQVEDKLRKDHFFSFETPLVANTNTKMNFRMSLLLLVIQTYLVQKKKLIWKAHYFAKA